MRLPYALVVMVWLTSQSLSAQGARPSPAELELRRQELAIQQQELELKRQDSAATKSRSDADIASRTLELDLRAREINIRERDSRFSVLSTLVALCAIAAPAWLAVWTLQAQRKMSDEQAKLQFQMKTAELALSGSDNAHQTHARARALRSLFSPTDLLPKDFAERFDPTKFKLDFGRPTQRKEDLTKFLAKYPAQRDQLLADWFVLFDWDSWWIEPLLSPDAQKLEALYARRQERRTKEEEYPKKQEEEKARRRTKEQEKEKPAIG